jgi:hypothetical protein
MPHSFVLMPQDSSLEAYRQKHKFKVIYRQKPLDASCWRNAEETRQAMYVKRNTEVHSLNQCCHGKALQITYYSECVSVTSVIQHAMLYYTLTCGLFGSTTFFCIIPYMALFSGKNLLNIKSVCGNKMPTRCNRWIFIADLTACSTCFGHLYAHHQEL